MTTPDPRAAFTTFAEHFVRRTRRSRVVHDLMKKPHRLMGKVCHRIDEVFDDAWRGGVPDLPEHTPGFHVDLLGRLSHTTWGAVQDHLFNAGGGNLFVSEDGRAFYAESEGHPPDVGYGGIAPPRRS